jgi:hypothetical protein
MARTIHFTRRAALLGAALALAGCSHDSAPPPPPPPGVVPTAAQQQGSLQNTLAHNPQPGQPNYISPEQQKELEHYQTLGNGAPQAPAPAPGQ